MKAYCCRAEVMLDCQWSGSRTGERSREGEKGKKGVDMKAGRMGILRGWLRVQSRRFGIGAGEVEKERSRSSTSYHVVLWLVARRVDLSTTYTYTRLRSPCNLPARGPSV
jgi:hypothetical protein